jgi:hypothetical protein
MGQNLSVRWADAGHTQQFHGAQTRLENALKIDWGGSGCLPDALSLSLALKLAVGSYSKEPQVLQSV